MNLPYRIELLSRLGEHMLSQEEDWLAAKEKASLENNWFIPEFVELAIGQIANNFLNKERLESWLLAEKWQGSPERIPRSVGIVMAGNIPLVGFHDWLCVFITGNIARVKPSSKDKALISHLTGKIAQWSGEAGKMTIFSEMLKGCDAYIATGSNNSSRYFDHYFGKYPNIIRRNRTSVAVLDGTETKEQLEGLADDVYLYFGLGCRNVTKIYVPGDYDFVPLLEAFRKYNWLAEHHKYKNNYDYNLAILLLNKKYYMSNGSILIVEEPSLFSPISQLNYEFYSPTIDPRKALENNGEVQCIVGKGGVPFGSSQSPYLDDYADGVDTLKFLAGLSVK